MKKTGDSVIEGAYLQSAVTATTSTTSRTLTPHPIIPQSRTPGPYTVKLCCPLPGSSTPLPIPNPWDTVSVVASIVLALDALQASLRISTSTAMRMRELSIIESLDFRPVHAKVDTMVPNEILLFLEVGRPEASALTRAGR